MNRNTETDATILNLKKTGENNRLAVVLTPNDGIITAILYGGPKSKLRAMVSPYHSGRMWLYHDPVRHSTKISDFDVTSFRPTLREDLYKSWAASLCSELLIKTCATGAETYKLACGFLDGLDLSSDKQSRLGTLRFLWRYQHELGVQPDIACCTQCGTPFGTFAQNERVLFSPEANGFICPDCLASNTFEKATLDLYIEGICYLQATQNLPPKESRALVIGENTFTKLQEFLFYLTARAADGKLKTLDISNILW